MKHAPKPTVKIYDTTLRDGNQAIGISLSLTDKLRIAEKLHELGVHYIEGGWPTPGNTVDLDFFKRARTSPFAAKVAVFGSTRRKGVSCAQDPLVQTMARQGCRIATIFGKSWDLHVREVIGASLEENLAMIGETVAYFKRRVDEVIYDAEHFFDGYRENPEYALKTLLGAREAGAGCVVLCDTNGGMLPAEFLSMYRDVRDRTRLPLGVHMHNDSGCAVANSLLAVAEGAVQVQGTINGLGERCGNANLCTIIAGLQLKRGYDILPADEMKQLTATARFVSDLVNIAPDIRQPYVGESAFSHKAGTHADGVRKVRRSFEHVPPESVGNKRTFVVSDQAGASTILERLAEFRPGSLDKKDQRVRAVLSRILAMEACGYQFEAADGSFELVAREILDNYREPFQVKGFRVIEEQRETGELFSEATIKIVEGKVFEHTAAEGDGPVNALDNALRKALIKLYPSLSTVKLEDFKVRVLDGKQGTGAKVRVLIGSSDGDDRWGTVGVSTNIIEASWLALVDSLKFKLMKDSIGRAKKRNSK